MRITNRHGLPTVLVETIENDQYDSGKPEGCEKYITITSLVRPPQINQLSKLHAEEIEYDASDLVWALLGSGFHATRERLTDGGSVLCEERLYGQWGDWTVSSKIDVYDPREAALYDYKVCKVYATQGEMKPEWFWQLQFGGVLLRRGGWPVERLSIMAICKDWSHLRSKLEPHTYPQSGVQVLSVAPLPEAEVDAWVEARLRDLEQVPPRPCSDEERWAKGGNWAAMKKGQKRAKKLFDSEAACEQWIRWQDDATKLYVEERTKEFTRCEGYCPVAAWCPQWARERQQSQLSTIADDVPF